MVNRVGGLASGMDIDGLVEKLMKAEKAPLNKLYQKKQTYEWQRDAYRDVNKQIKAFNDFLSKEMLYQKDLWKKTTTSNNDAISATATTAKEGASLDIASVTQLATSTRRVGNVGTTLSGGGAITKSTTLADLGVAGDQTIEMKVHQKDGTFKNVKLSFKETDTINSVISELNNGNGLKAFYDERSGQISITTEATGTGGKLELEQGGTTQTIEDVNLYVTKDSAGIFQKLGFGANPDLTHSDASNPANALNTNGQNAKLTVNGIDIERSSNTFDLDGVTVTLNDTYTGTKPISITTKTDSDHLFNQIKKFVDTYNGLVESLNSKTKEKKYRDYAPLTDEQKADMEKSDIEKWDEKAKSGILRSDSMIRSGLSALRSNLYEKGGSTNADLDTLYELGITTTKEYSDGGKLEIDEEKLRAAIAKDPEAVVKTFTNTVTDSNPGESGIVQKLRSSMNTFTTNIEKKAGKATMTEQTYSLGKNLLDVDSRISTWKVKLENIEQRYWNQFTAMEKAINKANQQSSIFMQGAGGGF
ncbi:flagellar hook-associated protein 2 [Lysinibacillus sp. BPa_S21]|uniref:flagellar hook-associated protein 2 n=1 Tax=Lysinibacillus sp. BPa_S21 TaxID=2932478 RepID=UPI002010DAD6|nr:flagellar hook-associated protein 2 [Lysinibacillus sp. BPa_S21]MCL1695814.1 flagellar hook-associated protein 2 [Lysinibacillus sp. BPa_S21]